MPAAPLPSRSSGAGWEAWVGCPAILGFMTRWLLSILLRPDYPIRTKLRFTKGMARSMDLIWPELGERIDFARDVARLDVPVHLFAGDRDRITDLAQIEDWYEALRAPSKRLEVVSGAGHLNLYEAPARFIAFMDGVRDTISG